jgi:outer membrane protein assembly factor BamB
MSRRCWNGRPFSCGLLALLTLLGLLSSIHSDRAGTRVEAVEPPRALSTAPSSTRQPQPTAPNPNDPGRTAVRLVASAPAGSNQTDWRMWRGPSANGIAAEGPEPPISWSETKNVIWKTPVPGRGHSSPILFGSQLFITTADDRQQVQSVLAFHRQTGQLLWQTSVSQGGFSAQIHPHNTHASPTVAVDGERLFVTFFHHESIQLSALSLDGKLLWQRTVGPFQPQRYRYGYAPSPTIYQDLVIVAADFDGPSHLTAFDRKTGNPRWKTDRPSLVSYSSPIVARVAGRDQLLLSGGELVASYAPLTGKLLWSTPATTMATCGTMVWDGDLVFASGGFPKSETVAIRADGSGQIVWRNNQKCYEQSMLATNGFVYAVTDNGIAYCWEAQTGKERWQARLPGGAISASPIIAAGKIYATNERSTTYVFRAQPTQFELLATNPLEQEMFASATISSGQIFMRVASRQPERQETLYCLGLVRE